MQVDGAHFAIFRVQAAPRHLSCCPSHADSRRKKLPAGPASLLILGDCWEGKCAKGAFSKKLVLPTESFLLLSDNPIWRPPPSIFLSKIPRLPMVRGTRAQIFKPKKGLCSATLPHAPLLGTWTPHLGSPWHTLDPYGFMVGAHGRLMGSTLAPHGHPWLPKMVFCVNLNRNLTGQLGTYCKLTEPILPFSGFKLPLDTLVAARAMPIVGERNYQLALPRS